MQVITQTLSPAEIPELAQIVALLRPEPPLKTLRGDAVRGRAIYAEACMACHRYNASGELAFRSAPLTGRQDWYLLSQLQKFRDGIRGGDPTDEDAAKMHLAAKGQPDLYFLDVIAFLMELPGKKKGP